MATTPATPSLRQQRARFGATAGVYTLVVIAILVAVNYLANRFNKPLDLTSNKRYTLSPETAKAVSNLKDDATITYFDVPRGFADARGLLDRYKNLSSKIHVEYANIKTDPLRARRYGVRRVGVAFVENNGRREEARTFDEQGITGAFLKLAKGVREVCVVSGSGERSIDAQTDSSESISAFKTLMERDNYTVTSTPLLNKSAVPTTCKVVIVAGPKSDYPANEVSALKTYVEAGGRVFFLLDPPLDFAQEHISDNAALMALLASWGVTVDKDLILEQNELSQFNGLQNPLVNKYETHPIVSDLGQSFTVFPLARSLTAKSEGKSNVTKLFSSSDQAVATVNLSSDRVRLSDPSNKKGPFLMGVAGTYDTGKPNENGRFVVIGSSNFAANNAIGTAANRDLALNAVNWLSSDEDLISIRQKEPEDRKLDPRGLGILQYTDLYALPLLIIVMGVSVFLKRR